MRAGKKVVVFSQWRRMLHLTHRLIQPALDAGGDHCIHFHGGLSSAQRTRAVAAFHHDPKARVFFATDAGGVGLNLQQAAHTIVHLETPWNPAVFEQRVGRVHRMGQTHAVEVLTLMSDGGIEPRIAIGLAQKQALFDSIFEGAEALTFGERESFVQRMKRVVGVPLGSASLKTAPFLGSAPPSLVQLEPLVDAETCQVPGEVPLYLDSIDEASIDEASIDEASIDQASIDQASPDQASPDQASPDQASPDQASIDQASIDQASIDQVSIDQASIDQDGERRLNPPNVLTPEAKHSPSGTLKDGAPSPGAQPSEGVQLQLASLGASLRARREGDEVRIDLRGVSDTSWAHLKVFLESLS